MASGKQELEDLFVTKYGSPCQGRVSFEGGIWIAHVGSLNESFDKKEIVFLDGFAQFRAGIFLCHEKETQDR